MADNAQAQRRFAYNNNRVFIEELPDNPPLNNNRAALPAIKSPSPLGNNNNGFQQSQSQALAIPQKNSISALNTSLELNTTQQRVKQLESRIQLTESSNRALLEEVVRLQNDLAQSLRKSLDSLQEERSARQQLENSYRFQYDNMLQLNGRLKRTEDTLQEDRSAMQSLIIHTKSLEQAMLNTQKDLFVRRDLQANRLDELRIQIDDLQRSKENLERSAFSLLDEIKVLKSKVDLEALSLNTVGSDLRNKTRRLEEENRQQMETLRKQQDSMSNTENNIYQVRSQFESKVSEVRDTATDLRSRIDREKEERRNLEQHFTLKFSEFSTLLNEDKLKFAEILRLVDSVRRENNQNLETERSRLNTLISEVREVINAQMSDKVEKVKDDLYARLRDLERLQNDEAEQRSKFQQNLKETTDSRIDTVKRIFEEEIRNYKEDTRETLQKSGDSIRKLNEGLNLVEQQSDETKRQLEKVIGAEIKLRKQTDKDFDERLNNSNEKYSYAMSSFQATLGSLSAKLNEQKDLFVSRQEFENMEKKHERLQADIGQSNVEIIGVKETLKTHQQIQDNFNAKIKDLNESVYTIENIQLQAINTKLNQMVTSEQLSAAKKQFDEQLREENKKLVKQSEEKMLKETNNFDDKITQVKSQLNNVEDKYNQKIDNLEKSVNNQIKDQSQTTIELKNLTLENNEKLKTLEKKIPDEINEIEIKVANIKADNKKALENEIKVRSEEIAKIKADILKIEKTMGSDGKPLTKKDLDVSTKAIKNLIEYKNDQLVVSLEAVKEENSQLLEQLKDTTRQRISQNKNDTDKAFEQMYYNLEIEREINKKSIETVREELNEVKSDVVQLVNLISETIPTCN